MAKPTLNLDIFLMVGQYVENSPDFIMRWAMVCKPAYRLFTSDKIWKRYNPYRLERDIYKHFMQTCTKGDLMLLGCERDPDLGYVVPGSRYERVTDDQECAARNWYVWTAILLGRLTAQHPVVQDKPLILALTEMDAEFWKYTYIADQVYEDLGFVFEVCRANRCAYMYHELWHDNKQLALQVLEQPCPHRSEHNLYTCSSRLKEDPDIQQAIRANQIARRMLLLATYADDEDSEDETREHNQGGAVQGTHTLYTGMDTFLDAQRSIRNADPASDEEFVHNGGSSGSSS